MSGAVTLESQARALSSDHGRSYEAIMLDMFALLIEAVENIRHSIDMHAEEMARLQR